MADTAKPSLISRAVTLISRASVTIGFIALAGFAIVTGVGVLSDRAAAVPEPDAAAPLPVEVAEIQFADSYALPRRFMGQIEARASVALSFELGGRITTLDVEEGDTVEKGQIIARLDTDLLNADVARLEASRAASLAQLDFAEARLTRSQKLQKQGFASTERLDEALATRDELVNRIAETNAALAGVKINIEKSVLYAPFDGQVGAQAVEGAETVAAGQPIVTVIETSAPEFRVGLPLDVEPDQLKNVEIQMDGIDIPATLKQLRPDVDPVTRTRTAIFKLDEQANMLFGRTATLLLETEVPTRGAWIPVDALQSGEGSVWTVLIVQDDQLRRAAVEIQHIEGARAFVRGTFDAQSRIVTSGAHRVVSGQTVTVIGAEG